VGGERHTYHWRLGDVSYRVTGQGTPLALLHGINAAASVYEVRENFGPLGQHFRVYAPDLLGFGLSDRPRVRYTAEIYVEVLSDFLRDVVGGPAYLVASSLSSAFAIRAARRHPELVRGLVLICPTGIERLSNRPALGQRLVDLLFSLQVVGPRLFALLVSRPSVRYFLRSITYHQRSKITPDVVEAYHRSGQRPGALWAPQAFIGGRLNLNITDDFSQLRQPILLVWGRQAKPTPLTTAPAFLERNPCAVLKVFDDAGLLPHDEQAGAFNTYVLEWIKEQEA
jgi:pimeloyl-ACP methyl ester carboxylesterase